MDTKAILSAAFDGPRDFDVELWDGHLLPRDGFSQDGRRTAPGRVLLQSPAALAQFIPPVDERSIAETFVAGHVDIAGDTIAVLEAVARWKGPRLHLRALPWALWAGARTTLSSLFAAGRDLFRPVHSVARDARSVRHHYDVSDDFYRLFLDDAMVYSCAYFPRGDESIDEAQQAKLELACRKLNLKDGERLLELGCGWGALLLYASGHYGVKATGVTVSGNQLAEARRRVAASHAASRVEVLDCDYRRLPSEPVHKIVSIGMMEHVGAGRLDQYFGELHARLRPGGLLLNQAIAEVTRRGHTVPWMRRGSGGFMQREIFPDSELPPLGAVIDAAERQGFEVRDVECLREHYAQTLTHWLSRLERRFDDAISLVGERKARMFRLYLAASAVAFRLGQVSVYQTLLAKPTPFGHVKGIPRSRAEWCDDEPRAAPSRVAATG